MGDYEYNLFHGLRQSRCVDDQDTVRTSYYPDECIKNLNFQRPLTLLDTLQMPCFIL